MASTEENALPRSGSVDRVARPFAQLVRPLAILLGLACVATAGVGLWLFSVIAFVLPEHDPSHIPMWRTIAVCCLAYSALSWARLGLGPRNAALRGALLAASVAALGAGVYGIVDMILRANRSGDFEGYIAIMGLIISGHGLVGICHSLLAGRVDPRSRG